MKVMICHYDNDRDLVDSLIMCLRAGFLSEQYFCRSKCITYDPNISGNDLWQISRIFYKGVHEFKMPESFEIHLKGLEVKTMRLIKGNWSFIEIIAAKLLSKEYLTVDGLNELWKLHQLKK